jgi:LacI family transcriptional regulator
MNKSAIPSTKRPTISDVARKAGLGVMTVSRVINNKGYVTEKTRKQVLAAIAKVGFRPNPGAQLLKGQRARMIGLIVPDLSDVFFAACAHSVQEIARSRGYLTLVLSSNRDPRLEKEESEQMASQHVAGLLIVPSSQDDTALRTIFPDGTPIVALDRPLSGIEADAVVSENRGGTEEAITHLFKHGCRDILCIGYDRGVYTTRERVEAYTNAMRFHGLTPRVCDNATSYETTHETLQRLFKGNDRPDGIFCINHRVAMHVLKALQDLSIRVPKDVAVIGFDDLDFLSMMTPPLSTVAQSALNLGQRAAILLFDRISNQKDLSMGYEKIVMPTKLIIRQSCGCNGRSQK